jgi:hypothetical protein
MCIAVPPTKGPTLTTEADGYEIGDVLKANCTSSPSRPATNLTFLINNKVVSILRVFKYENDNTITLSKKKLALGLKTIHKLENGMEYSQMSIILPITDSYYKGGKMTIRCISQLHPIYAEYTNLNFISMQEPSWQRSEFILFS